MKQVMQRNLQKKFCFLFADWNKNKKKKERKIKKLSMFSLFANDVALPNVRQTWRNKRAW